MPLIAFALVRILNNVLHDASLLPTVAARNVMTWRDISARHFTARVKPRSCMAADSTSTGADLADKAAHQKKTAAFSDERGEKSANGVRSPHVICIGRASIQHARGRDTCDTMSDITV